MNTKNNKTTNIDEDAFAVDIDQQKAANKILEKKTKRSDDPRYWKPRIQQDKAKIYHGSYQAMVRLIPPLGWLEDKSIPFSIEQRMHYFKEPKYNMWLYGKCRKTLGAKEKCPLCDANWAVYNAAKERGDKFIMDIAKKRIAVESYICNIIIVTDLNHPELNGEIKLWEHTPNIHSKLLEPLIGPTSKETVEETQVKKSFKKEESKQLEYFMPHHPTKGRNYIVIIEPKKDNPSMVSYDASYWDEQNSVIGWYDKGAEPDTSDMIKPASTEEIVAVLERSYSLKPFIEDVPSAEELVQKLQEFNDKLCSAGGSPMMGAPAYVGGADVRTTIVPKPEEGDSKQFFAKTGKSTDSVKPTTEAALEVEEGDFKTSANDDGDEDLPF